MMQYCVVKSSYGIADKVRAGEAVAPDALVAALDELVAEPWSDEMYEAKRAVTLALLASSTRVALYRAIAELAPIGTPATIQAVLLDEGDPLTEPFPENPWGIGPHATLVGAIDHVWDLFEAPRLTNALLERVLALVLLDLPDGPHLGYVRVYELDSYAIDKAHAGKPRPPHDRRHAMQWLPFGDVTMFLGAAPSDATHGKYGPIPAPLRVLYRCHAGLHDGMWRLAGPDDLLRWSQMLGHETPTFVDAEDPDEQIRSDELVYFFGYGDDRSDLFDMRDPDEPVIRAWGDGHLYEGGGELFLEWLEDKTSLMLGISEG